jgi:hypothetical protein
MATSSMHVARPSNDIKLEYGVPQIFALKFTTGKNVESRFPGGRVMFTAIDDRKLFLDDEDANDFERSLNELRIGPADFIQVTKIRHARGGGHSIRVEAVDDSDGREPATETQLERQLTRSIEAQREKRSAGNPEAGRPAPRHSQSTSTNYQEKNNGNNTVGPQPNGPTVITPAAALLCGAFMAAIEALHEARQYSQRSGFGDIVFTSEDLRACALSVYINQAKGGR